MLLSYALARAQRALTLCLERGWARATLYRRIEAASERVAAFLTAERTWQGGHLG
jgi:hypothetical protein